MAKYLVAISIGPVQEFIAAARRTRDLWFGSELLSELSKSIARELYEKKAQLIFPAPENSLVDLAVGSNFNVGNKLLAVIETNEPNILTTHLKSVCLDRWKHIAENVVQNIKTTYSAGFSIDYDIWNAQINDAVEVYFAWVICDDNSNYTDCRNRVDELLAARKNTRDFVQSTFEKHGVPKSSLCGLRESVFKDRMSVLERKKLGLDASEQLDCAGVVKRLGGLDRGQFTPISRLAIDPWVRGLSSKKQKALDLIGNEMNKLIKHGIVSKVTGNNKIYKNFPYDGQLLYPFRFEAMESEIRNAQTKEIPKKESILSNLEQLKNTIKSSGIYDDGIPSPYVAILHADGDHMGKLLSEKNSIEEHRAVSSQLAKFAIDVPGLVRECRGDTIYSGGDDVLAMVPIDNAIDCAFRLKNLFSQLVSPGRTITPSLSVGIAIGHVLEPMSQLLKIAFNAEKLAKGNELESNLQKNALAIILKARSGAPIEIRCQWRNNPQDFLNTWIKAYVENEIPDSAAYQLRSLAKDLKWADENTDDGKTLLKLEALRVLNRKRSHFGKHDLSDDLIETIKERIDQVGLHGVANELILVRRLAEVEAMKIRMLGE